MTPQEFEKIKLIPYILFAAGTYLLLIGLNGNLPAIFWGLVFMWFGAENAGLDGHISELRAEYSALLALIKAERGEGE